MTKKLPSLKQYKIVSLRKLCEKAGIGKMHFYDNLRGKYKKDTLTMDERTMLANTLYEEVNVLMNTLGFNLGSIKRIKTPK